MTPIAGTSQLENEFKPVVSLKKFPSFSENSKENPCFSQNKIRLPLSIDVESSIELVSNIDDKNEFEESEFKGFSEYQNEIQRIKQEYEEKVIFHAEDTKKIIANKYKAKYKAKIQETLVKQNEIHKFQLDSLKKHYESKILKYKEIIERLHKENEELANGRTVKHSDLMNPLIEENLWLKKQLSVLKPKKKKFTK